MDTKPSPLDIIEMRDAIRAGLPWRDFAAAEARLNALLTDA